MLKDGFWWEEPSYQPPYEAGVLEITFDNATSLRGIFSYADGTWGSFTGTKVRANLTDDEDLSLQEIPQFNWAIDKNQTPGTRVSESADTNPITVSSPLS